MPPKIPNIFKIFNKLTEDRGPSIREGVYMILSRTEWKTIDDILQEAKERKWKSVKEVGIYVTITRLKHEGHAKSVFGVLDVKTGKVTETPKEDEKGNRIEGSKLYWQKTGGGIRFKGKKRWGFGGLTQLK